MLAPDSCWSLHLHIEKTPTLLYATQYALKAIVQVARSLGTKTLNTNRIFSLRGVVSCNKNTDLKPLNNRLQHINHQISGEITNKIFQIN